jgi:hypothetical protein
MKSGEHETSSRIYRRYSILNQLEHLIKQSVYYRSFSFEMRGTEKIVVGNIDKKEIKAQLP